MRSQFLIAFIFTFVGAGTYWYKVTEFECPAPLHYRLGQINESFNITPEEARIQIAAAEKIWEDAVRRELFIYDENANFTIDFVYDERQKTADSELSERGRLDAQKAKSDELQATVTTLKDEYQKLSATYEARVDKYETRLSDHNAQVNQYNDKGGAPAEVFDKLEKERQALNSEMTELNNMAGKLQTLATKINQVSDEGNKLVESYNQAVAAYNREYGKGEEFTQGDFSKNHIHVYKFSNETELQAVLAHEFGHALGLDHVDVESSLMYYLLNEENQSVTLSSADLEEYYSMCGQSESFAQKVRRIIRGFINN